MTTLSIDNGDSCTVFVHGATIDKIKEVAKANGVKTQLVKDRMYANIYVGDVQIVYTE